MTLRGKAHTRNGLQIVRQEEESARTVTATGRPGGVVNLVGPLHVWRTTSQHY